MGRYHRSIIYARVNWARFDELQFIGFLADGPNICYPHVAAAQPEAGVIVDAADFGAAAGDAAIVAPDDLTGPKFSTLNAGLSLFVRFLQSENPAEVVVIGVHLSSANP